MVFWDVDEKHFAYAGSDQISILILFYQSCLSYVFLFVVWELHGKESKFNVGGTMWKLFVVVYIVYVTLYKFTLFEPFA